MRQLMKLKLSGKTYGVRTPHLVCRLSGLGITVSEAR